jgi:chloride channel 7
MLACAASVIVYSLFVDLWKHGDISEWYLNSASLKFDDTNYPAPTIQCLPAAIFIGLFCGLLGAFYVWANTLVNLFRKDYMFHPTMKVLEVCMLSFVTTSVAYWLPYLIKANCYGKGTTNDYKFLVQYNCPDDYYNPMATLFFNTESTVIKSIVSGFSTESAYGNYTVLTNAYIGSYGLFFFFFSMLTYGTSVPSGVFLFAIITGCAVG